MHPLCRAGDKRPASAVPFGPGERFDAVESPKVQQLLPQAPAGRQQARQGPASDYETAAAQGGIPASLLADTAVEVPPAAWPPYIAPEAALAGSKAVFDDPEGRRGGEAPQAVAAPKRVTGNAVPALPAAKGMWLNALRQALSNGQAWARSCRQMQASLHPTWCTRSSLRHEHGGQPLCATPMPVQAHLPLKAAHWLLRQRCRAFNG